MSRSKFVTVISLAGLIIAQSSFAAVSTWQKGGSFSPRTSTEFSSDLFKQSVRNLKSTGANYVTLIIPYYQPSLSATTMGPGNDTPTDQSLIDAITYAHSQGMSVNLKPHLQITGSTAWRATVTPSDRNAWFASYEAMLTHYARIAQAHGVEQITLATEIINMASTEVSSSNTAAWNGIISRMRQIYSGHLTYSSNWGSGSWASEKDYINFWDKLDSIGVSAYFYMTTQTSYTMQQLRDKWHEYNTTQIQPLQQRWGKPVIFTEVGYRSIDGALMRPPQWSNTGTYDGQEQADAYEALFSYWNDYSFMQGIHLWEWRSDPNAGGVGDRDFTPQNKPAQEVMTRWFGGEPAQTQAFSTVTTNNTVSPQSGIPISINTTVRNVGTSSSVAVDVEVYNSTGTRVFQQVFDNQSFLVGESRTYNVIWTPATSGVYTVKVGLFSPDWSQLVYWNNNALRVDVAAGQTTTPPPSPPTPPPSSSSNVTKFKFFPRSDHSSYAARMVGGLIQGSNTSQTSGFTTLATITTTPTSGEWNELTLTPSTPYRYLRYLSPADGYGNVAEVEFYNGSSKLQGTTFGSPGSWQNRGNDYTKAFDGNIVTFFDAPSCCDQYAGIDTAGSQTSPPAPAPQPPPPPPTPTPPPGPTCNLTGSNNFFACYFDNSDFTNLRQTRTDNAIDFNWGGGSPDVSINSDTFSARWQGNFTFEASTYDFRVTADDGIRVWIDNVLVLDKWFDQGPTTYDFSRTMSSGNHLLKVEYYENGGGAVAKVGWTRSASTPPSPAPTPTPPPPAPAPQPPPPPSSAAIDIWWPANNATVSGTQPFQAIINGMDINSYTIHWQVDGGTLNGMHNDSSNGYMHKRSWVDVSGWSWKGNGPYVINFVARNTSGQIIAQRSVQIYIGR